MSMLRLVRAGSSRCILPTGCSRGALSGARSSSSSLSGGAFRPTAGVAAEGSAASAMEDEYGEMDDSGKTFHLPRFTTESGVTLHDVQLRYRTWGELNAERDNVLVVCHALTGNAALDDWWSSFLGDGLPFDTSKYYVICANLLGSCYGSTGPSSINPQTGEPYAATFPRLTVRDGVAVQKQMVRWGEGVKQVKCVIGGSLGGMQTVEWLFDDHYYTSEEDCKGQPEDCLRRPDPDDELGPQPFVRSAIPMACGTHHHTWQIAVSEAQRQCIYADPDFQDGAYYNTGREPKTGIGLARMQAMVSYRSHAAYEHKFGRRRIDPEDGSDLPDDWQAGNPESETPFNAPFSVETYLKYQGEKFHNRFDANSYITLTQLMDTHDIGRGRGGIQSAAAQCTQPVHVIGIDSDVLYPVSEQEDLADALPNAQLSIVRNDDGHDGFLLAQDAIGPIIHEFLDEV